MSNVVICRRAEPRRARLQLIGSLLAMAALATQLPGPVSALVALGGTWHGPSGGAGALDQAALLAAALVVWLMVGWWCVVCGLAALARVPGVFGRFGRTALGRLTPVAVRRVVIAGMGVSVLTGAAACGVDQPTGVTPQAVSTDVRAVAPDGERTTIEVGQRARISLVGLDSAGAGGSGTDRGVPSRPGAADRVDLDWPVQRPAGPTAVDVAPIDVDWPDRPMPAPSRRPAVSSAGAVEPMVIVEAGDSLWLLAAEQLGPTADDADIDAAWRAWYTANRRVIGDDPDLILPGQRLRPPPLDTGTGNSGSSGNSSSGRTATPHQPTDPPDGD